MRTAWLIILFLLLSRSMLVSGIKNPEEEVCSAEEDSVFLMPELQEYVDWLISRRSRFSDESRYLSFVFERTHRKILKRYHTISTYEDLIIKGDYDCVTGTAVLAYIYQRLGIKTKIIETPFHVYMLLEHEHKTYLVESTDPHSGFISDSREIALRKRNYRKVPDEKRYVFNVPMDHEINLHQLIGLIFFNQSVKAYNARNPMEALHQLHRACHLYPSERIHEMAGIILGTFGGMSNEYACLKD